MFVFFILTVAAAEAAIGLAILIVLFRSRRTINVDRTGFAERMKTIYLTIPLICLFASIVAGLAGKKIGRKGAHSITIGGVAIACILSVVVYMDVRAGNTV